MGDVVNTASRLQSHAPTGRLIVGDATYRSTRQAIRYEPHDAVTAKGKAEPVAAWLAVEALPKVEEDVPSAAAFVGRGRELELVRSVWDQAVDGRQAACRDRARKPGCRQVPALPRGRCARRRRRRSILRGRCLPYEETTGYHAFSQLVRQVAGIFDSDRAGVARDKLATPVESTLPTRRGAEQASRPRASARAGGGRACPRPGRAVLLRATARRASRRGAADARRGRGRPLGGDSELDLFEYLGAHVRETRVLFIALARPELLDVRPAWGVEQGAQARISLEPLAGEDATEMAVGLLPERDDDDRSSGSSRVAEGNPLFIEELVAATVEQGGVDQLPVTVRAVDRGAHRRASARTRATRLLSAAVIGRTFWQDVLRAVAGHRRRRPESLDDLERRDLIRREPTSRLEGDVEFRFKHALIRDVAYGTLPRAIRRERHAAIARFVEEQTDGAETRRVGPRASLARGGRAGEGDPAPPLGAARSQSSRGRLRDVVDLYSQALELAEDVAGRARIRFRRAHAFIVLQLSDGPRGPRGDASRARAARDFSTRSCCAGKAYVWTEQDTEGARDGRASARARTASSATRTARSRRRALVSEALASAARPETSIARSSSVTTRCAGGGVACASSSAPTICTCTAISSTGSATTSATFELGSAAHELGDDVAQHRGDASRRRAGGDGAPGLGRHEEALATFDVTTEAETKLGGDGRSTSATTRRWSCASSTTSRSPGRASELALERAP